MRSIFQTSPATLLPLKDVGAEDRFVTPTERAPSAWLAMAQT